MWWILKVLKEILLISNGSKFILFHKSFRYYAKESSVEVDGAKNQFVNTLADTSDLANIAENFVEFEGKKSSADRIIWNLNKVIQHLVRKQKWLEGSSGNSIKGSIYANVSAPSALSKTPSRTSSRKYKAI